MNYFKIIEEAEAWVREYSKTHQDKGYCFHDITHTMQVVNATEEIAKHYKLENESYFTVIIAAYFHDLGYYTGGSVDHELRSAAIAQKYLEGKKVDLYTINAIKKCILSTKFPQSPSNLLEEIVCDADLFHLGNDNFLERDQLMKMEKDATCGGSDPTDDWANSLIGLMQSHSYHTDYVRQLLDDSKQRNIELLKKMQSNSLAQDSSEITGKKESLEIQPKKKKKNKERPDRGIETMFRVTATNNQRLSDMADNKANILLTVNSIILSVIIALLLRKLDENVNLTIPTIILLFVSLSTMVVAILATRPIIPNGEFTEKEVVDKSVNLLFFGNFYKMDFSKYTESMKMVMEDRDFLYGTLTKDIYSQGVALGRKYKLLRLGYNIFMFGLILSVIAFTIAITISN
ncbi:Pycsar system effector family protein [Belliella marina]|uniref:Pycsar system effector family protein n=1 Tax=Belliella marina TaxID=1644146 RepID=A0ABW4VL53_9BACT